jgi:eukaryotic-like serine/threonine-protein kinase
MSQDDKTLLDSFATQDGELDLPGPIGAYRPIKLLGAGGMGRVYLAEQTEPVQRQVALKIIARTDPGSGARAFFEIERQALAQMQHPAIAQVFDAGTSQDGKPWFAMEWVPGETLTDYCRQKALTVDERLKLFSLICRGVQHAHQRGIIHRDLKPANILVREIDGQHMPKIIDFGIATSLADASASRGGHSPSAGTPAYMSPELFRSDASLVDVRTDVFSLGVLLFELLTELRPPTGSRPEILEAFCTRLGQRRVSGLAETCRADHDVQNLAGHGPDDLPFELRCILARALAPNREQRYQSAVDLADDIHRYLCHEPVEAGPRNRSYLWQKWLRRNRMAVGIGGLIGLALLVALTGVSWGLVQAQAERDRAQTEALRAEQTLKFLTRMLASIDPDLADGADTVLMRRLLEDARQRAAVELDGQISVEAEIQRVIGRAYLSIGAFAEADQALERARWLADQTDDLIEQLTILEAIATLQGQRGEYEAALVTIGQVIDQARQSLPENHSVILNATGIKAHNLLLTGQFADAITHAEPIIQASEGRSEPGEITNRLETLRTLMLAHFDNGEPDRAEQYFQQLVQEARAWDLPDSSRLLSMAMVDQGTIYARQRRYPEAEAIAREALQLMEARLGKDHIQLMPAISNLASAIRQQDRLHEAAPLFERALALAEAHLGAESLQMLMLSYNQGNLKRELGDLEEALRLQRFALATLPEALSEPHPLYGFFRLGLGQTELAAGNLESAETLLREANAMISEHFDAQHFRALEAAEFLIKALQQQGKHGEASAWQQRLATLAE